MSFVNNSGSLWDFIELENDWQSMSIPMLDFYNTEENEFGEESLTMPHDHIALEKLLLKRDAEILNHCSYYNDKGNLVVTSNPMQFINRRVDNMSSSSSIGYSDEELLDEEQQAVKLQYSVQDGRFTLPMKKLVKKDS